MPRPERIRLVFWASWSMSTSSDIDVTFAGDDLVLRLASAAYLARFTGSSRIHCGSDLRLYFTWCTERHLLPVLAVRAEIERYVRWMQETRRFKPSTVAPPYRGSDRVLAHVRHRRREGPLAGRVRPPTPSTERITDTRTFASTVRSAAHRGARFRPPVRLRARCDARTARVADLRDLEVRRRGHRRGTLKRLPKAASDGRRSASYRDWREAVARSSPRSRIAQASTTARTDSGTTDQKVSGRRDTSQRRCQADVVQW